jgi:hypothetical protein
MKKSIPITQRAKSSPLKMNPAMAVVGAYQTQNKAMDLTSGLDLPEEPPKAAVAPPGKKENKPTPEMCKANPKLPGCEAEKLNEEDK